jgi:hypothetical protein
VKDSNGVPVVRCKGKALSFRDRKGERSITYTTNDVSSTLCLGKPPSRTRSLGESLGSRC